MIKTALISVYDKRGIVSISKFLQERGVDIISTGGTFKHLKKNGIKVREVSDVTGFEEILDGRVKTLHPNIHGGILAKRDNKEHVKTLNSKNINPIDMVIVNLYPFFNKINEQIEFEKKMEFIDIGGPTMIRAAAKNFKDVVVLTDIDDYKDVINQIEIFEDVDLETRRKLAGKVFNLMSAYDGAISKFLLQEDYPKYLSMSYEKNKNLRYGENPHQTAAFYTSITETGAMKDFTQLNGKELSYNNIKDMDIAWKVVEEFDKTACCALKHNSPCGVALANNVCDAYKKAYNCDPISIFGGIVAFNEQVDKDTAQEISKIFLEIIIAPDFTEDALEVLKHKKNLRVIRCNVRCKDKFEMTKVDGGVLVQSIDNKLIEDFKVVTKEKPCKEQIENMIFAMKVVKYVKSNAIVIAKDMQAIGISGGQVNRIWSACEALNRGKEGTILASDGFLPFKDVVQEASKYNIKSIIQPGGSIRDKESIDECDKYKISMIFTGNRHFKH